MEETPRRIAKIMKPQPVVEGAGVRLRRSVATRSLDYLDPFYWAKLDSALKIKPSLPNRGRWPDENMQQIFGRLEHENDSTGLS